MKTKAILFAVVLTLNFELGTLNSFAQDTTSVAQKQSLNYFKIEVGIIIDCPVLPMNLHDKLIGLKGIKDYHKNQQAQNITFNIPEGVITKEQVIAIAVSCGFPAQSINVLMDKKPFSN